MTDADPADRLAGRALAAAGMDAFEHDVVADRILDTGELAVRLELPADQTLAAFESRIHPEDRDMRRSRVERCTPSDPRYRIAYRLSDAAGEWVWIEESGGRLALKLRVARLPWLRPGTVQVRLSGIRKGFAGKRFPMRTHAQFVANEAFINSAYPGS